MKYKKKWEQEDREQGLSPAQLTGREMKKIFDSIHKELVFEIELCDDFPEQEYFLPTLDFQIKLIEGGKGSGAEAASGPRSESRPIVSYVFFEKRVSKKTAIRFES